MRLSAKHTKCINLCLLLTLIVYSSQAFVQNLPTSSTRNKIGFTQSRFDTYLSKDDNQEVKLGTKEYYAGLINRDLGEVEARVSGDKLLIPTLKFVGGFAILIGIAFIAFMVSNGLL